MSLAITARFFRSHPLTRNHQLRAWARFVAWQLKSRLQGEVIHPWVAGQKLAVRRGMSGATGNIYAGLHEFIDMMLVMHFLREGELFVDVGANIGSFSILASGVCKARTIALEPDQQAIRQLQRNISINSLDGLIEALEVAAGPRKGEVQFTTTFDTTNYVAVSERPDTRIVKQETLDALIGDREPVMIKVDAEGYEEQVLDGAAAVLARHSLKLVTIEGLTDGAEAKLRKAGFERVYYAPFSRELREHPTDNHPSDPIFARDLEFVSGRLAEARPVDVLGRTI